MGYRVDAVGIEGRSSRTEGSVCRIEEGRSKIVQRSSWIEEKSNGMEASWGKREGSSLGREGRWSRIEERLSGMEGRWSRREFRMMMSQYMESDRA